MTDRKRHEPNTDRLEELYRRAADAEPEGRVDDAVLGKARKSAYGPGRSQLRHPGAWGVGLAAAASLVLAVGLFLQQEGGQPARQAPVMEQFRSTDELQDTGRAAEPAAPATETSPPPGERAGLSESSEMDRAEGGASRTREQAKTEERDGRSMRKAEQRLSAPVPAEEAEQLGREAWLEHIRGLVRAGRLDEARVHVRRFREIHPSAEIPTDIREALAADSE